MRRTLTRRLWSLYARTWHATADDRSRWDTLPLRAFGDVNGLRALDLGCGTGEHARTLAAAGATVVALDFAPGMLRHAQHLTDSTFAVEFVSHDFTNTLPFPSAAFDLVLCASSLQLAENPAAVLSEVARVLVTEGRLLVMGSHGIASGYPHGLLPRLKWIADRLPLVHKLTPIALAHELRCHGLEPVTRYEGSMFWALMAHRLAGSQ